MKLRLIMKIFPLAIVIMPYLPACFNNGFYARQAESQKSTISTKAAKKLEIYLTRLAPFGFAGAVLVAEDGKIILSKGFGLADREKRIHNTSSTVFSTGSLTKQFTAAAIMKLEMMGKLNTDEAISKYFPDVPEDKTGITIHQLLTHTSGLIGGSGSGSAPDRDEEIKHILSLPLSFAPGIDFQYSNEGYSLLAAIIEIISGQEYETFLKEHLFMPAGMNYSGYHNENWTNENVAVNYAGDKNNGRFSEINEGGYPNWKLIGNGGIGSTVGDMYRWHIALLGEKILSKEAKKKLFTPVLNDYAYGWDVIERKDIGLLIQHNGGSTLGNGAEMRRYMDKKIVTIAFSNQDGIEVLLDQVRDKMEAIIFGLNVPVPPEVKAFDAALFSNCEGTYLMEGDGRITLEMKNNALVATAYGQHALDALYFSGENDAELNDKYNKWTKYIFASAIRGDYVPLGKILADEERLKKFKKAIDSILARFELHDTKVQIIGTVPSVIEHGGVATFLIFKNGSRALCFALLWKGNRITGLDRAPIGKEFKMTFLPVTDLKFIGYDIGLAKDITMHIARDVKGELIGLLINGKSFKRERQVKK